MFHVKHCPLPTRTLHPTTVTRDERCSRRPSIARTEQNFVLCKPLCRFSDSECNRVSPIQSLSEKNSERLQARFGVLDALPDDALHTQELGRADVLATVVDEDDILVGEPLRFLRLLV